MDARWVLFVAAVGLSGCAEPARVSSADGSSPGAADVLAPPAFAVLSHDGPEEVNETRWHNGSFQPHETCNASGCPTGTAFHEADLTDAFPAHVPVRFQLDLAYPDSPVFRRPLFLDFLTEDVSLYNVTDVVVPGREVLSGTLLRGAGTVRVVVFFGSMTLGSGTSIDYTLRFDVVGHRDWTPGGVPLLVPLGAGIETVADVEGPKEDGSAVLFGPDDAVVGRLHVADGELAVGAEGLAGEHVIVFPEGVDRVRIRASAADARFRALPLSVERGDPHDVAGVDPIAWSFPLARPPVIVGLYEESSTPLAFASGFSPVEIRSPQGTALQTTIGCGFCLTGGYGALVRSAAADPALVPGTYEVRYEPQPSAGLQVGHVVVNYAR